jgi:hypothetical protein
VASVREKNPLPLNLPKPGNGETYRKQDDAASDSGEDGICFE